MYNIYIYYYVYTQFKHKVCGNMWQFIAEDNPKKPQFGASPGGPGGLPWATLDVARWSSSPGLVRPGESNWHVQYYGGFYME